MKWEEETEELTADCHPATFCYIFSQNLIYECRFIFNNTFILPNNHSHQTYRLAICPLNQIITAWGRLLAEGGGSVSQLRETDRAEANWSAQHCTLNNSASSLTMERGGWGHAGWLVVWDVVVCVWEHLVVAVLALCASCVWHRNKHRYSLFEQQSANVSYCL